MALIDFDDIQAAENRRREVAVKAGESPRDSKYAASVYKDQIAEYVKEAEPEVSEEFTKTQQETKLPGYNFGATAEDAAKLSESKEKPRTAEEDAAEMERLLQESKDNELKVTRTATGQPKIDEDGNPVSPIQGPAPEQQKSGSKTTQVSAAGSGDARAAANVSKEGESSGGSNPPAKK